jgi:hypothetical protein
MAVLCDLGNYFARFLGYYFYVSLTSMIMQSMEIKWIHDPIDGWIAYGECRRYRVFAQRDGWSAVRHSWSASWPRRDSQPVHVQVLATGVSLEEAKARCQEHSTN